MESLVDFLGTFLNELKIEQHARSSERGYKPPTWSIHPTWESNLVYNVFLVFA